MKFDRGHQHNRHSKPDGQDGSSRSVGAKSLARLAAEEAFLPVSPVRVLGTISLKEKNAASQYAGLVRSGDEGSRPPRVFRVTSLALRSPTHENSAPPPEERPRQGSSRRPGPVSIVYSKPLASQAEGPLIATDKGAGIVHVEARGYRAPDRELGQATSYSDVQLKLRELDAAIAAIRFARSIRFKLESS